MADYLNSKNIDEAVNAVREMRAPKHFLSEMLNMMVVYSLDRSDEDKEHASTLIHSLCTEGLATGENLMQVIVETLFLLECTILRLYFFFFFYLNMEPLFNRSVFI